ncbi:MAG: insulinase family protein [Fusobacterium sp.]|nr:insulinase family protein [Fusobacterium sp.]
MREIKDLKNGTQFVYKQSKNTPRTAFCFNLSLNQEETIPGLYVVMTRLFMQGTKTRSAEQLARELDEYAIELSCELKSDYLSFKFVCLNEDFDKAVELLTDIVKNTTFDDYQKEIVKYEGEIQVAMDSPRNKALEAYFKNIYANHPYGNTETIILENLGKITKEDIINAYKEIRENSRKVISIVGDVDFNAAFERTEEAFGDLEDNSKEVVIFHKSPLTETIVLEQEKEDLNQAHIIKGWLVPTYGDKDLAALKLLNIILGASGLSSRLFCELRDKKGLAYVVRSSYDTSLSAANFRIYIATEPKNIETALAGFKEEIDKIKVELVPEKELSDAKNNLFGKWAFSLETNLRQASLLAHYGILRLGFDYLEEIKKKIQAVTAEDLRECANKYFTDEDFVLSVLKP